MMIEEEIDADKRYDMIYVEEIAENILLVLPQISESKLMLSE